MELPTSHLQQHPRCLHNCPITQRRKPKAPAGAMQTQHLSSLRLAWGPTFPTFSDFPIYVRREGLAAKDTDNYSPW